MHSTQCPRLVLALFVSGIAVGSMACADSPTRPSPAPAASTRASVWLGITSGATTGATLAPCLGGSGAAICFADERLRSASSTAITSAPVLNGNQPVLNSGSTVTLVWTPPAAGAAVSYLVEAASAPGGPANLASVNTGTAATTLVVPDVPSGTYFVRVRALDGDGASAPSNEVQVVVAGGGGGGGASGSCPSAPRGLTVVSQSGGTVTLAWMAPLTGTPASYVVQAGATPGTANLASVDTNSTALSLNAPNVPPGTYYVRVYARSSACAPPALLGPASNEVVMTVGTPGGTPSGWSGQIECRSNISGPGGYAHQETQTWTVAGSGQVAGVRTTYPVRWSARGSGGAPGKSWTIDSAVGTDLTVTVLPSGIPIFDRTTGGIIVRSGIVGSPISFDLYEMEFPTIVAASANATSVAGTWSRPTVGGDSPQQPGASNGMLNCSWALSLR